MIYYITLNMQYKMIFSPEKKVLGNVENNNGPAAKKA